MIIYVRTNIFESNAQVLVNTVNTVGVMGKGLAQAFKKLYPDMFESYQNLCETEQLDIGNLHVYKTVNKWVLNFPTKKNWRSPSKLEYIELGLKKFVSEYERLGITSVAFPLLGCGNGGLDWEREVKPLMERYLKSLPIEIFIHTTHKDAFAPEHVRQKEIETWLKSEAVYLSSLEFVTHIKQQYQNLINEIHYNDRCLEVSMEQVEGEDAFCLNEEDIKLCVTESMLKNIWHVLKSEGFLTAKMLSEDLAQHAELVMAFLAELEYITLTQVGDETSEVAVRLLPFKQSIVVKEKVYFAA